MYLKLLGCKILEREISSVVYNSKNAVDVTLIRQQYHETPKVLKQILQEEIDKIDENSSNYSNDISNHDFEAIVLGFGLCSEAVTGLHSKKYPLVIPKVHDCIALLMGGQKEYRDYAENHQGTFYYSPGYVEHESVNDRDIEDRRYQMYLARFKGKEKLAKRAMEIEKEYTNGYDNLTYINWSTLTLPEHHEKAEGIAKEQGWSFCDYPGNNSYFRDLVDGNWNEERFLIVPPGYTAEQSYDWNVLKLRECPEAFL